MHHIVPENNLSIPPPQREFHATPPSSPEFPKVLCTPPIPPGKIVLARKYVKVKVNTQPSAWHVTAVYSRSIITSEDTYKENRLQFI